MDFKRAFYPTKKKLIVFIVFSIIGRIVSYTFFVNAFLEMYGLKMQTAGAGHAIEFYSFLAVEPATIVWLITGIILPYPADLILALVYYYAIVALVACLVKRVRIKKSAK